MILVATSVRDGSTDSAEDEEEGEYNEYEGEQKNNPSPALLTVRAKQVDNAAPENLVKDGHHNSLC